MLKQSFLKILYKTSLTSEGFRTIRWYHSFVGSTSMTSVLPTGSASRDEPHLFNLLNSWKEVRKEKMHINVGKLCY